MQTTLNEIKKHNPCHSSWAKGLKYLNKTKADDEPIDFMTIHKVMGIKDTIWCLKTQDYKDYCLFLADVAESVLPIFEAEHPDDKRPRQAIKAIRDWYNGDITKEQLKAYDAAAYAAAYATMAFASSASIITAYAAYDYYIMKENWKKIDKLFIKHFGDKNANNIK